MSVVVKHSCLIYGDSSTVFSVCVCVHIAYAEEGSMQFGDKCGYQMINLLNHINHVINCLFWNFIIFY